MQETCRRHRFDPWVGEAPLKEEMATHSSILAWRIPMDRGSWRATVHGVAKSDVTDGTHTPSAHFSRKKLKVALSRATGV